MNPRSEQKIEHVRFWIVTAVVGSAFVAWESTLAAGVLGILGLVGIGRWLGVIMNKDPDNLFGNSEFPPHIVALIVFVTALVTVWEHSLWSALLFALIGSPFLLGPLGFGMYLGKLDHEKIEILERKLHVAETHHTETDS